MPDSTSNLYQLAAGGDNQEARLNELIDAFAPFGTGFGRNANTTSGLTFGFYGVPRYYINATATTKANGTTSITANSTRYLQHDRALAVTEEASFAANHLGLYKIVTSASAQTSWEDHRDPHHVVRFLTGYVSIAMADANKTLTYEQAMCDTIELTGSNSAQRDVIVPLVPRAYDVICSTTTNGIRVIGASGTGISIAVGKAARVFCDGTNVRRITADA